MADAAPSSAAIPWFEALGEAADRIAVMVRGLTAAERRVPQGAGAGGDTTVLVDRLAEEIVIDVLGRRDAGLTLISEEAGEVAMGAPFPLVVVDPIDGSLNAKRGLPIFAVSIAVADGPSVGDVWLGMVRDLGSGETLSAERGVGAWSDGTPLVCAPAGGRPDMLALEGASPTRMARAAPAMTGRVARIRALGSAALSICHAAAGRVDAMASLGRCRSVDVAAAVLIAREAGAVVGLPDPEDVNGASLALTARYHVLVGHDRATYGLARDALAAASGGTALPSGG